MSIIKGAKAGQKAPRKAQISPDSAASKTYLKILYGLSEGEIEGLVNGLNSVYLDDTPIHDAGGVPNFQNVSVDFRAGTNAQTFIEGFPDVSNEIPVEVELTSSNAWVRSISNADLDAVRIRLRFGAIRQTNPDNGDVKGYTIEYAIDVKTTTGAYKEVLKTKLSDKTSTNYERSHRVDLPPSDNGWQVRVRRITPNTTSEYISDKMYIAAITEVIDVKLRYPNLALLGLQYDAETFSSVAKMAAHCRGVRFRVPSNYDPVARKYTGMWDGTFKRAYTNNPAWIYFGICTEKRFGLGDRLADAMVDKWSLYRLAQYCDQFVDDGKGGTEPRFTCNVYLQSKEDAYAVLSKLAGVFRAISFWDGDSIVCDADMPQDTQYTYTRANVIDGQFEYTGTRTRDRHSVAKVAWDNPANRYKTEYEFVRDEAAIAKLGYRVAEIDAWGCTSQGQAQRAGLWALRSEQLETRTVTFKVGLDGHIPQPGKIIEIADELFAGRANGGRVSAISTDRKKITLDRDGIVCQAGDRLVINGEDGIAQARAIQSIAGRVITVTTAFAAGSIAAQNVWAVDAQDLKTMRFRVISITQSEKHIFTITALQHEPQKYAAIDSGTFVEPPPISILKPTVQVPVASVAVSARSWVNQGLNITALVITWPQAEGAVKYQVEWKKDDGAWIKLPTATGNLVEVDGIYSGNYQARVVATDAFESSSLPTYSALTTVAGKVGLPPKLAFITATGILFGMRVDWGFPATGAKDTAYTEIQVSPNGASNIAQLGLFAYPTNTTTIQGLQGNLTQYYRGRLIDRIGNVGAWSNWVIGETSADASAVLGILNGKITESQLHQDLQTTIGNASSSAQQAISAAQDNTQAILNEVEARGLGISSLQDGLTAEVQQRSAGDDSNLLAINNYKANNDAALANVRTIANSAVTASSSNTNLITQLTSEVAGKASASALTNYYTKAQTNTAIAGKVDTMSATLTSQINNLDALSVPDTRHDNQPPSWYWDNYPKKRVTEFKRASTIWVENNGMYVDLESTVPWNDASGGAIKQIATGDDPSKRAVRYSTSTTAWSAWKYDIKEISDEVTATANTITSVNNRVTVVDNKITATANKVDLVEASVITSPNLIADPDLLDITQHKITYEHDTPLMAVGHQNATGYARAMMWFNDAGYVGSRYAAISMQAGGASQINPFDGGLKTTAGDVIEVSCWMRIGGTAPTGIYAAIRINSYTGDPDRDIVSIDVTNTWRKVTGRYTCPSTAERYINFRMYSPDGVRREHLVVGLQIRKISYAAVQESIEATANAAGMLGTQWTMKLDVNGRVAGIGLANSGISSDFIIRADRFAVAAPASSGSSAVKYAFVYQASSQTIDGTTFPAGLYLDKATIASASITTGHIENAAIKTAKIDNLAVTEGKIANLAVDTLKIKDEAVTVPSGVTNMNQIKKSNVDYAPTSAAVNEQITQFEDFIGTVIELNINRSGGKLRIDAGFVIKADMAINNPSGSDVPSAGGDFRLYVTVYMNSALLARYQYQANATTYSANDAYTRGVDYAISLPPIITSAGNGAASVQVKVGFAGISDNLLVNMRKAFANSLTISNRSLAVLELKK